jgi:hypothetical protein
VCGGRVGVPRSCEASPGQSRQPLGSPDTRGSRHNCTPSGEVDQTVAWGGRDPMSRPARWLRRADRCSDGCCYLCQYLFAAPRALAGAEVTIGGGRAAMVWEHEATAAMLIDEQPAQLEGRGREHASPGRANECRPLKRSQLVSARRSGPQSCPNTADLPIARRSWRSVLHAAS